MLWNSREYQKDLEKTHSYIESIIKKQRSIVVTGGTGLIGSYIVDMLVYHNRKNKEKIRISVLCRNKERAESRFGYVKEGDDLHIIQQDVTETVKMEERADWIVHLASNADPVSYAKYPVETILTNVEGTKNILQFARKSGSKVLFASTMEVYGKIAKKDISEDDVGYLEFGDIRAGYPESKRTAEILCRSFGEEYGVVFDIARLGYIYGPTMAAADSKAVAQFFRKAAKGESIELKSAGTQRRAYCYVADVVTALFFIMDRSMHNQVYNVADRNSIITIAGLAEKIAKEAGVEVLFAEPGIEEKKGFSKTRDAVLNEEKLKRLGWEAQTTIDEGIKNTLKIMS